MYTSTLCTHLYIVLCEGATDYKFTVDWLCNREMCKGVTDYAHAMSWMCIVCVSAVCACSPVELC